MVPLVLLFLAVVQVAVYVHVRNVMTASAAEGARYAANADVAAAAGGPRAIEIAATALSATTVAGISCGAREDVGPEGLSVVAVSCTGQVPTVLAALGPLLPLRVSARSLEESA